MSKPNTRRVIPRVARFAIASGGVYMLLSLPAQQADAATGGPLSGLTDAAGSIVTSATGSVTGPAPACHASPPRFPKVKRCPPSPCRSCPLPGPRPGPSRGPRPLRRGRPSRRPQPSRGPHPLRRGRPSRGPRPLRPGRPSRGLHLLRRRCQQLRRPPHLPARPRCRRPRRQRRPEPPSLIRRLRLPG
jgi:hypothetical protein